MVRLRWQKCNFLYCALFKGPLGPKGRKRKKFSRRLLPSGNTLGWNFISFLVRESVHKSQKSSILSNFRWWKAEDVANENLRPTKDDGAMRCKKEAEMSPAIRVCVCAADTHKRCIITEGVGWMVVVAAVLGSRRHRCFFLWARAEIKESGRVRRKMKRLRCLCCKVRSSFAHFSYLGRSQQWEMRSPWWREREECSALKPTRRVFSFASL